MVTSENSTSRRMAVGKNRLIYVLPTNFPWQIHTSFQGGVAPKRLTGRRPKLLGQLQALKIFTCKVGCGSPRGFRGRLDFRHSLGSGLRSSPKSSGGWPQAHFPEQRLEIEPLLGVDQGKGVQGACTPSSWDYLWLFNITNILHHLFTSFRQWCTSWQKSWIYPWVSSGVASTSSSVDKENCRWLIK